MYVFGKFNFKNKQRISSFEITGWQWYGLLREECVVPPLTVEMRWIKKLNYKKQIHGIKYHYKFLNLTEVK